MSPRSTPPLTGVRCPDGGAARSAPGGSKRAPLAAGVVLVGVLAIVGTLLAYSGRVEAQPATVTLVSNTSETSDSETSHFVAQAFTTGSNSAGYTIAEIQVFLQEVTTGDSTSVRIRENSASDRPGDLVATLTNPATFSADALNTFTAPDGTTLTASTTYWVTVGEGVSNRVHVRRTDSNTQTGASGWSLADGGRWSTSDHPDWAAETSTTLIMAIKGTAADNPGVVSFSGSPELGQSLTASLADDDGSVENASWQWARGETSDGTFTDISGATSASYTPVAADTGRFLRATVSYDDAHADGKTASGVTTETVPATVTLVSNTSETSDSETSHFVAQAFTTGSNSAGYTIAEIQVFLQEVTTGDSTSVRIRENSASDRPGDLVATLTNPATFSADALNTFTAPDGTTLTASTTYWVTVGEGVSNRVHVRRTDSNTQTGASGWSLADGGRWSTSDHPDWAAETSTTLIMAIKGTAADNPGVVSFSGSPELGQSLTASLADDDGSVENASWQWARGETSGGTFSDISGATAASYTPVAADTGRFLRATVSYDDGHGDGKTASGVASETVLVLSPRRLLVGNTGQSPTSTLSVEQDRRQEFTTGSVGGFRVERVGIRFGPGSKAIGSVTLNVSDGAHTPGDLVATLGSPSSLVTGMNWFTVPEGTDATLDASTTYMLVLNGGRELQSTTSDSEDSGGVAGWSISNVYTHGTNTTNQRALKIRVEGSMPVTSPPAAPRIVSASWSSGNGGEVSLEWDDLEDPSVLRFEVRHKRVGGSFGGWAEIAGSDADTTAHTVAGVAAGGVFEFEVRAVSNFGDGAAGSSVVDASPLLVTNAGQGAAFSGDRLHLQQFGTGSHARGYVLSSVEIVIDGRETSAPRVRILSDESDDSTVNPQVVVAVLVDRGRREAEEADKFWRVLAAPAGTLLAADSTYYIEITSTETDQRLYIDRVDAASGQDSGGEAGWTLGGRFERDTALSSTSFDWGTAESQMAKVRLSGMAVTFTAPQFTDGDTAARTVLEGAAAGTEVGDPVAATDADGDDVAYSVTATSDSDAAAHLTAFNRHFALDASTGQVTVRSGVSIRHATRSSYVVQVRVTDGEDSTGNDEATPTTDDTVTLTITVDRPGAVTVAGLHGTIPIVDREVTASVADPDGGVRNESWQWSFSADGGTTFVSDTPGASYTPLSVSSGYLLRATVTYDDTLGADKTASFTTSAIRWVTVPAFFAGDELTRVINENRTRDTFSGVVVSALDDDGDDRTYSVTATSDSDASAHLAAFNRHFASAHTSDARFELRPGVTLDFESRSSYAVLVHVSDCEDPNGDPDPGCGADDTLTLTINVHDLDEPGAVTLSNPGYLGERLTAALADPDAGVAVSGWQWARGDAAAGPFSDIAGETAEHYTPTAEDDTGKFLRVTVTYDDTHGNAKTVSATTSAVRTRPVSQPVRRAPNTGGGSGGGGGGGDVDVGVATFVVANGWSPADVGTASVLAARTDAAVVLYTAADTLSEETRALAREASPAEVIIVGGTAAVSHDVRTALRAASGQSDITRITGADRADTAAQTARRVLGSPTAAGRVTVVVANGWSPPDIGTAAALAARSGRAAVAYTQHRTLPEPSAALLRDYDVARVIIVGGTAAISNDVQAQITAAAGPDAAVARLVGADRVDTAAQAARRVLGNPLGAPDGLTVVVANGWSPPDVGVAAALAAATDNAAVAYVNQDTLPEATAALIRDYRVSNVIIIGGRAAVTDNVRTAITQTAPDTAIRRITGTTRTDTAAKAAKRILADN